MTIFLMTVAFFAGILLGRAYEWMKWHYPESREMIAVKLAARRVERLKLEKASEKLRTEIDDEINRRMAQ